MFLIFTLCTAQASLFKTEECVYGTFVHVHACVLLKVIRRILGGQRGLRVLRLQSLLWALTAPDATSALLLLPDPSMPRDPTDEHKGGWAEGGGGGGGRRHHGTARHHWPKRLRVSHYTAACIRRIKLNPMRKGFIISLVFCKHCLKIEVREH